MLKNHLPKGEHVSLITDDGLEGADFGLGWGIVTDPEPEGTGHARGSVFWGGAQGTWFWIDPSNELFFIGMVQCSQACENAAGINGEFANVSSNLVRAALIDVGSKRQ